MKIDLSGQRILVTGASRGIGRAVATGLAKAGARVGVHYARDRAAAEGLCAELGGGATPLQADFRDAGRTVGLFADALAALGGMEGLVNNAGIALPMPLDRPAGDWIESWDTTHAVNLRATGILCRGALAHFRAHGGGRIVNVASRAAFRGDAPDYLAYASSKGGQVALTRSIARAFGKEGVKAFLVAPGYVRTGMSQQFIDEYGEEHAMEGIALERMTEPADLVPLVVLLMSGLADHATGGTFDVNAGSYVH